MRKFVQRLYGRYLALETFAKGRPLLSGLGVSVLSQLLSPTGVLQFLQAALIAMLTFGSLAVGLLVGSGLGVVLVTWFGVHVAAFVLAMVLGLPFVILATRKAERWSRWIWIPILLTGGIVILGIRMSAAVWLWENVAGLPRWFSIPWVLGTFVLSVVLRAWDSGRNTAKRGRLAAVAIEVRDQWDTCLLERPVSDPFVYVVGSPFDDDLDREIDRLVIDRRVGSRGHSEFLYAVNGVPQSVQVTATVLEVAKVPRAEAKLA